ncbi:hypothetical protein BKA70DRAFT_1227280 [Coprinopsis sp. MPI-PUGE-AT-0042]|nr:hypothetical protein BKA70DRAFT_1227280 [Coprinopsis sp. MPI-PUGE-AT-0042]
MDQYLEAQGIEGIADLPSGTETPVGVDEQILLGNLAPIRSQTYKRTPKRRPPHPPSPRKPVTYSKACKKLIKSLNTIPPRPHRAHQSSRTPIKPIKMPRDLKPYIGPQVQGLSFNSHSNLVFLKDIDGTITVWSPSAVRLFFTFDGRIRNRKGVANIPIPGGMRDFSLILNRILDNSNLPFRMVQYNQVTKEFASIAPRIPTSVIDFSMFKTTGSVVDPRLQMMGVTNPNGSTNVESIGMYNRAMIGYTKSLENQKYGKKGFKARNKPYDRIITGGQNHASFPSMQSSASSSVVNSPGMTTFDIFLDDTPNVATDISTLTKYTNPINSPAIPAAGWARQHRMSMAIVAEAGHDRFTLVIAIVKPLSLLVHINTTLNLYTVEFEAECWWFPIESEASFRGSVHSTLIGLRPPQLRVDRMVDSGKCFNGFAGATMILFSASGCTIHASAYHTATGGSNIRLDFGESSVERIARLTTPGAPELWRIRSLCSPVALCSCTRRYRCWIMNEIDQIAQETQVNWHCGKPFSSLRIGFERRVWWTLGSLGGRCKQGSLRFQTARRTASPFTRRSGFDSETRRRKGEWDWTVTTIVLSIEEPLPPAVA